MKRTLFFLLTFLFLAGAAHAQNIEGVLQDATDQSPVQQATIMLLRPDSSATTFSTLSNNKGAFSLKNIPVGKYLLSASSVGYNTFYQSFTMAGENIDLGVLSVAKAGVTLQGVVISGAPPPVRQRDDTLEFAASQYKVNPDATGEDLIKKVPGITVDRKGTVTAGGETVNKVTVDGRDFFGDDATATLRNLPSEVIDKIQVFDKLSDQAQLTGFDDGNTTKSINIVTKKDMRTGNFGRIFAGYGTDDRYSAGGNVSFFNNARRISLIGLTNNVNQQNFASTDLLGVSGGGGGRGGGRRGGGGGDFMVGQQSGIAKTNAFGINYSDEWGSKIEVAGSYFFNNSNTSNNQVINRQNFINADTSQFYDENTLSSSKNYNNRVNFRLNYKIDSSNTLLFTSGLNFQNNNSFNSVDAMTSLDPQNLLSSTFYNVERDSRGYNLNNNLIYRHAFAKRGRSISLGINTSFSKNDGETYTDAENVFYKGYEVRDTTKQLADRKNNTSRYSINLVYTEPVGKKAQLQLNYNPSFQESSADQQTYNYDRDLAKYSRRDTILSNVFDNTYNTHNTGLTYRLGDRNNMISAGLSYQYSELKSDQVFPSVTQINRSYNNLLGNAMARLKLSDKSNLRIMYRNSVNAPSVNQLQNVINNSNQLFYSTGNPELQQASTNRYIVRYNYTDRVKNHSLFANVFVSTIKNYISNATYIVAADSVLSNTVTLHRGSQLSKPVNLDGYVSARSFVTYSMPLKFMKSTLNWNGGFGYSRQPGLVNRVENVSNNYNYNIGAVLSSNISEYIDFTVSYSANINDVHNTLQPKLNNNYVSTSASVSANLLTKKGTFFQNELSNESYNGLTDGFNQSYWLWNVAIGQKFLKDQKGEIKLSVFDLLKQNKSISRDVTEIYVQDVKNQVLQQYFMLTFTYKLKTFGKGKQSSNNERDRFPGGGYPGYMGPRG